MGCSFAEASNTHYMVKFEKRVNEKKEKRESTEFDLGKPCISWYLKKLKTLAWQVARQSWSMLKKTSQDIVSRMSRSTEVELEQ